MMYYCIVCTRVTVCSICIMSFCILVILHFDFEDGNFVRPDARKFYIYKDRNPAIYFINVHME